MQKREKARVERRLEAEADALPHKAAMRQPSLQSVVASCNDKNKAADDTVFAFAGAGIPLDKLDHPLVRAWLQKYTTIAGCLPQGSSDFPKVNGQRVLDGHRGAIHKKTADRNTTLLFAIQLGANSRGQRTAKRIDTPSSLDWAPCGLGKASGSRHCILTGG